MPPTQFSPDRVVVNGKTFWRASGGRLIPAVEGGAVATLPDDAPDLAEFDNPTSLEDFEAARDAYKKAASQIAQKALDDHDGFTDEERTRALDLAAKAKEFDAKATSLRGEKELVNWISELMRDAEKVSAQQPASAKSLGEQFVGEEQVKAWLKRLPNRPETAPIGDSPALTFKGLRDLRGKNVITGGDHTASAGALFVPDFLGLIDTGLFKRPLVIGDLVSHGTTTTDLIDFVKEHAWTINADFVAEASGTSAGTASGDVAGLKPESDFQFEVDSARVVAVAHFITATRRALSDWAQLASYIDQFLRYGLDFKVDENMVNGNGTGEHFTGLLNTSGIQVIDGTHNNAGITDWFGALRRAKRLVQINGRTNATAIVLDPAADEAFDLVKTQFGFLGNGPTGVGPATTWNLPRVVSETMPANTAIVADFRRAILWDREQASILTSDSHADYFRRNLIAILGELRAGFTVVRPPAFVKVNLSAFAKVFDPPA